MTEKVDIVPWVSVRTKFAERVLIRSAPVRSTYRFSSLTLQPFEAHVQLCSDVDSRCAALGGQKECHLLPLLISRYTVYEISACDLCYLEFCRVFFCSGLLFLI